MSNLSEALNELERERSVLASELASLNDAIAALTGISNVAGRGRRISTAGRARIAAAQRARWAKVKGATVSTAKRTRRSLSPAARKRIAVAQRARWAAWRKEQKAA